jgi:lysophospholipase L1-like esterase
MSWINRECLNESGDREKTHQLSRWVSWLFLAVSILVLIYIYYRAEIVYQGALGTKYSKYYMIALAGILFWVGVLRLREAIRANIVTVAISLIVGLYMIEGGLILLDGQPKNPAAAAAAAELGVEYDERTKLKVIEDLIAEGVDAVPAVQPRDLLTMDDGLLPLGGFSNKITVASNENGYYMVYLSDRYGFNNPDSEWDIARVDWLLTGDSFTEGLAVRPGEDIAGQIRAITNQTAISLGRSGNGPLIELAELIEYAGAIKPRKVLWIYYEGNDLKGDLQESRSNPLLMKYMSQGFSQNLVNRQQEVDNRLREYIKIAQTQTQTYKNRWIKLYRIRNIIGFENHVVDYPLFAKILTKAKAEVNALGGDLYFVYLPEYGSYNKAASDSSNLKRLEVEDIVKKLDIPVINTHDDVFSKHPDIPSLFPLRITSNHFNAKGYNLVAKAIVTGVKEYEKSNK